jgi:hypothetical protein
MLDPQDTVMFSYERIGSGIFRNHEISKARFKRHLKAGTERGSGTGAALLPDVELAHTFCKLKNVFLDYRLSFGYDYRH